MKLFLLLILIHTKAFALNQSFLKMPKNPAYMKFSMTKYLNWHRKNFSFPEDSELLRTLVSKLDHWTVDNQYLRQLTITHYVNEKDKREYRIRIFVHPSLLSIKDLKGNGLPENKKLLYVEWDKGNGSFCQIFRDSETDFSSWCRKTPGGNYAFSWSEKLAEKLPHSWKINFPVLGEKFIQKEINGVIHEVLFFDVSPHPSLIPNPLINSVFLHTRDALFPLDRVSNTKEGKLGIHYP